MLGRQAELTVQTSYHVLFAGIVQLETVWVHVRFRMLPLRNNLELASNRFALIYH